MTAVESKSPAEIKREFAANRERTRYFIMALPFAAAAFGLPGVLARQLLGAGTAASVIQYGFLAVFLVLIARYRITLSSCPACGEFFGRYFFGSSCPHCQAELT